MTPPETAATDDAPNACGSYRRLMAACVVAMVLFGASLAALPVTLPAVGREFSLTFAQRGLLGSVLMAALVTALLTVGYLADRVGKRPFLVWGVLLMGGGLALAGSAPVYGVMLLAQVVSGLGKGTMEALLNPLIAELNPRTAARHLNVVNGLFSVGLVVAALSAGELLEAGGSWRWVFRLWVPLAVVVAFLFATPRRGTAAVALVNHRWRGFVANPLFRLLFVAMILGGGCEAGMTFWAVNYVEHELGASPRNSAWTLALYGGFMALGRFASGGILARVTPLALMIASAALCGAVTAALCFVTGLHAAWALFALGGLFVACFWPTLLAVASEKIAAGSAGLFALLACGGVLGCVVFPWAMGALGDLAGLRVGVAVLPVSMALLGLTLLAFRAATKNRDGASFSQ